MDLIKLRDTIETVKKEYKQSIDSLLEYSNYKAIIFVISTEHLDILLEAAEYYHDLRQSEIE
jgi:hypothetical protein